MRQVYEVFPRNGLGINELCIINACFVKKIGMRGIIPVKGNADEVHFDRGNYSDGNDSRCGGLHD